MSPHAQQEFVRFSATGASISGTICGAAMSIGNPIAETIGSIEVQGRRVGNRPARVENRRAVCWLRDTLHQQRIAVDVCVVVQHGDHDCSVLIGRGLVSVGERRIVYRGNSYGHGCGRGPTEAVTHGI